MSGADGLFLEACGASGPLELVWQPWDGGAEGRAVFNQPALLVGRTPAADLQLVHSSIGKRHAYLQMVEGRLFAIDLDSRGGLRWSGVPRRSGWVDAGRPLELGPTTIRLGGVNWSGEDVPGPSPLSRRYVSRHRLPEVVLDIQGAEGPAKRYPMQQVLVTIGRSPHCKIRLAEPGTSLYACGLIRTPRGVWLVDLLSSQGVSINGVTCPRARLEDGDVLRIGDQSIRVLYQAASGRIARLARGEATRARSSATLPMPITPTASRDELALPEGQEGWEVVPDLILQQLQAPSVPPSGGTSAPPLSQALLMLVQLLGEIHKDHLDVIREEAEQIRRLNREMGALRAQIPPPDSSSPPSREPRLAPTATPLPQPVIEELTTARPAPQTVQVLVGDRLAAWERERQSRWRKVMGLLVKPC